MLRNARSAFFVPRSIGDLLADQGWRSNLSCRRTAPKHVFDLDKRATAQVLLVAHASPEVLPNPVSKGFTFLHLREEIIAPVLITAMEPFFHLQPFTRFPS